MDYKEKIYKKRLNPTPATLLGHYSGNVQLETPEHHAGPQQLPVHGLGRIQHSLLDRTRQTQNS